MFKLSVEKLELTMTAPAVKRWWSKVLMAIGTMLVALGIKKWIG